jgi:hypothetical protein
MFFGAHLLFSSPSEKFESEETVSQLGIPRIGVNLTDELLTVVGYLARLTACQMCAETHSVIRDQKGNCQQSARTLVD